MEAPENITGLTPSNPTILKEGEKLETCWIEVDGKLFWHYTISQEDKDAFQKIDDEIFLRNFCQGKLQK